MSVYVFMVVFFSLIIACCDFIFKECRSILRIVLYIVLVAIMGLAYNQADYNNYVVLYENSTYLKLENLFDYDYARQMGYCMDIGYSLICKICGDLGLMYAEFKFVLTVVFLNALFYVIYKTTDYVCTVVALYMIYPFLMDVIQVRNFMVEVIIVVAFYVWVKNNKCLWQYIAILFFATTFHTVALAYLPFAFFVKYLHNKFFRVVMFFSF